MTERFVEHWVERKGTRYMVEKELTEYMFVQRVVRIADTVMNELGETFYLQRGKVIGFIPNSKKKRFIQVLNPLRATEAKPFEFPESKVLKY